MEKIPLRLSQASGVPYYRQITDQMEQMIRSGQLAAKTRLPSVRELAGELLVSLITVRRSYADLEAGGLIVRRQGRGTFVSEKVEVKSRQESLEEGREILGRAVSETKQLGLDNQEIIGIVSELVGEESDGE